MKKFSKIIILLLLLIILCFGSGIAFVYSGTRPVTTETTESVRVEISSGISVSEVSKLLQKNGLIKNARLFYYSVRFPFLCKILFPNESLEKRFVLKSGIYYLNSSMNFIQLQKELSSGQQEYIKVSIPEGLTISQIAAVLEKNNICSGSDFISYCKTSEPLAEYNVEAESCEGFLFPDTYFLTSGMKVQSVAKIMIDNFFNKIKTISGVEKLSAEELYKTIVLASIVEREYRIESEAPLIASVFKNRLRRNIGLYSCATIVYIITEIQGRPHPDRVFIKDTQIDDPYNTYKYAGLTPGPISNPGLVALNASVNTPKTDYYFFQIVDPDAGKHVFSSTFEEHKENHNLYIKK